MDTYQISPIGHIRSPYKEKFGTPRQPGLAKEVKGAIVFNPPYDDSSAFRGLESFDYIWVIFLFHQIEKKEFSPMVRPPRLGGNKKTGVFATRSPFRANPLGLSLVHLDKIESKEEGVVLHISGQDIIDGTPVIDIKPYLPEVESKEKALSGWTVDSEKNESLPVVFNEKLNDYLDGNFKAQIKAYLCLDPRPSYQNDERLYKNKFLNFDIVWKVTKEQVIHVEEIVELDETIS